MVLQRPHTTSVFLSAYFHPLTTITTTSTTMSSEEEQRLLAPVDEDEDDESTTPKPGDVPRPCARKRKEVTRSEFDDLQVQVSSVTAAVNSFGDMLKSFLGNGKKHASIKKFRRLSLHLIELRLLHPRLTPLPFWGITQLSLQLGLALVPTP